jgi:hypothetical protein
MTPTLRLVAVPCFLAVASTAVAQVRLPNRSGQTVGLARMTWTAVLPQPATLPAVIPNGFNIPAADLRPQIAQVGLDIRDQGNRPTCSVHAMTFLLEYMAATRRQHNYGNLSEEYLNVVANRASGKTDDGDFFAVLEQGYRSYGIVSELAFPYRSSYDSSLVPPAMVVTHAKASINSDRLIARFIKPWDGSSGASDAQLTDVMKQLKANVPVAVGMWWPRKGAWQTTSLAGVSIITDLGRAPTGALVDGHSVVLVGYAQHSQFPGGGYFIFRNSWGPAWGDKGYGYASFEYLRKYANDLVAYIPAEQAVTEILAKRGRRTP